MPLALLEVSCMPVNETQCEKLKAAIDAIDAKLNSGITQTSNDGITATISPDQLRKRRTELAAELAACQMGDGFESTASYLRPINLP